MAAVPAPNELTRGETRRRWEPAAIAGLAFAAILLRLAPLARSDLSFAFIHEDSFWFLQTAQGMLHGCGFARWVNGACESAEIMRTPGYPLMLALIPDPRWAMAVQDLMGGAICLLVGWWMWRCWGIGAALLAEFFIAFDLPSIVFADHVMSEQLFQFTLVLAMVPPLLVASGMLKGSRAMATAIVSAVIAGFAILVRPIGILIPFTTPIPYLFSFAIPRRSRIAMAAIAFALPGLAIVGWSARNYAETGYFGLSVEGPIGLYFFRAAEVVAREDGTALLPTQAAMGQRLGVGMDRIYDTDVQTPALVERMDRMAEQVLFAHPIEAAVMTLESAAYIALFPMRTQVADLVGTGGGSTGWGLSSGAPSAGRFRAELDKVLASPVLSALIAIEMLMLLAMWAGVVVALVRCVRAPRDYRLWVLYLTVVSLVLLVVGAGGEADVRFREPVVPLLAIVAALGWTARGKAKALYF